MFIKNLLLALFFLLFISLKAAAQQFPCGEVIKFYMPGDVKHNEHNFELNEGGVAKVHQYISKKNVDNFYIAVNVMCQILEGQTYTGSSEEWLNFFNTSIGNFSKSQYENIKFTLLGENERVVKNSKNSREYFIVGNKGSDVQKVKSLALMSTDKTIMLTLAISGNEAISTEIDNLYHNLASYIGKSIEEPIVVVK